jgi:hypothetical protein
MLAGGWLLIFVGAGLFGFVYGFLSGVFSQLPAKPPMLLYYLTALTVLIVISARMRKAGHHSGDGSTE